jgi:hydroxypyruvate isomerase
MLKFSANVGFLWEDVELPERIKLAAQAGFDAVECHFPYDYPGERIASVLQTHGLRMVGINTRLNNDGSDKFGMASLQGDRLAARELIDQAVEYAHAINAMNVNVVAGLTDGVQLAEAVYQDNLKYACKRAAAYGINILIEPLNPRSVPGYHFSRVEQAISTIEAVDEPNLKLMLDYFHTQIVQGDLITLTQSHIKHIGHVQISAVHDRGEPDSGEIDYPYLLTALEHLGYDGYVGAEYKPRGASVEAGLGWLSAYRDSQMR